MGWPLLARQLALDHVCSGGCFVLHAVHGEPGRARETVWIAPGELEAGRCDETRIVAQDFGDMCPAVEGVECSERGRPGRARCSAPPTIQTAGPARPRRSQTTAMISTWKQIPPRKAPSWTCRAGRLAGSGKAASQPSSNAPVLRVGEKHRHVADSVDASTGCLHERGEVREQQARLIGRIGGTVSVAGSRPLMRDEKTRFPTLDPSGTAAAWDQPGRSMLRRSITADPPSCADEVSALVRYVQLHRCERARQALEREPGACLARSDSLGTDQHWMPLDTAIRCLASLADGSSRGAWPIASTRTREPAPETVSSLIAPPAKAKDSRSSSC